MGLMEVTELLQEKLLLDLPPVGLAFVQEPPPDVLVLEKDAPSFCTLWRWAETRVFYAAAEKHMGCLIGGMVAGFPLSQAQLEEVRYLLDEMCASDDAPPEDVSQVPKVGKAANGIVYGPLWRFPIQPDLVLLWLTPVQAAVLQETDGPVLWRGNPQGAFFARPACSVLAIALSKEKPALSLGCVGMRVYTKMPEEFCLLAVPGNRLLRLEDALTRITDPEARLQAHLDKLRGSSAPD